MNRTPLSALENLYDPADIAEAAQYEAHRELVMAHRSRAEVDAEIASERRAITNIEAAFFLARTCAFCPAEAESTCRACDEWVCSDDLIDELCPDCAGLSHGGRGSA